MKDNEFKFKNIDWNLSNFCLIGSVLLWVLLAFKYNPKNTPYFWPIITCLSMIMFFLFAIYFRLEFLERYIKFKGGKD